MKLTKNFKIILIVLKKKKEFSKSWKRCCPSCKKSRTLNTFMSRAKVALWFMKSFGLELKGMTAMEQKTGAVHSLHVDNTMLGFDGLSN